MASAEAPAAKKLKTGAGPECHHAMVGDNFQFRLGPPESGFSIFLAERTKKIHFIRHAEGYHNVATKRTGDNECLKRGEHLAQQHELWDARLTDKGIRQAKELREYLSTRPSGGRSFTAFDLVVVSPLTRTLQTADAIFGPPRTPGVPAFLDPGVAPEGSPEGSAASTRKVPRPRILVREECRERWGLYVCDGRRPIREIIGEFPGFDFSEVEYDQDCFYTDERESDEHCCERAVHFLEWLNKRPEKCIAVVTHSSFLRHLFQQFGRDSHADDKDTLQRLAGNCELRSVVLCSHGTKDRVDVKPMTPDGGPASTVDLDMIRAAAPTKS
eukprot:TRINITY_DN72726_c0_g1_i1.p1 TRINITY_DN72726_c0_g1~~TRINITY_DN72726_c0_g1_i1.p1  ORF type:complete len:328 (-),score=41.68 TRINITY_DN72726_c0_g1_i1:117-1100(-)